MGLSESESLSRNEFLIVFAMSIFRHFIHNSAASLVAFFPKISKNRAMLILKQFVEIDLLGKM